MNFDSVLFFGFFPAVLLGLYALRTTRLKHQWLLLASYLFYGAWDWRFLFLIVGISLVAYFGGLIVDQRRNRAQSITGVLALIVGILLTPLFFFKYFDFFRAELLSILTPMGIDPNWGFIAIILPVGVSFYSFQAISYVIDVSRGDQPAEPGFLKIALYIAFFPQLVAGPIVRSSVFIPQLQRAWRQPSANDIASSLLRFAWGLFKKMVIADRLALAIVDPVFAAPQNASPLVLGLAVFAFGLMIYADFSAYSDMAIASARLMGFSIPENFTTPYLATSIRQFWRRWHISLSEWIRDYVYIPLGGSRTQKRLRTELNLIAAMALCGIWHGAGWTFLLWGLFHGASMLVERQLAWIRPPIFFQQIFGLVWTSTIVFSGWLLFRAEDLSHLSSFITALFSKPETPGNWGLPPLALLAFIGIAAIVVYGEQALKIIAQKLIYPAPNVVEEKISSIVYKTAMSACLFLAILLLSVPEPGARSFIYFQF